MVAARRLWDRTADWLLAGGLFAGSLMLYVQTLAPSVATIFDDSLEFPLVAHELAIAHPTGYPLYTLLGKLFTLGPFPNVAWAVNFLSAVAGALTVTLIYLITRQVTRHRMAAILGALALAVSPVYWSQSIIAEVYTLNSAFVAALLWLALRWARRPLRPVSTFSLLQVAPKKAEDPTPPAQGLWTRLPPVLQRFIWGLYLFYRRLFPVVLPRQRLRPHALFFALAVLFGLALTHHRLIVLLAPALLLFFLVVERRVLSRAALLGPEHPDRPRWLQVTTRPFVLLLVGFLVPLMLYLYLPIRGHVGSLDGTYTNTWHGFWQWVTASNYSAFLGDNPLARDLSISFYGRLFWEQFGPVGLALAATGLIALTRRPRILLLTGMACLTYLAFGVLYRVPDVEVFFIPAFLLLAIWIGVGLEYAAERLRPRGDSMALRRLLALSRTLLLIAAAVQLLVIALSHYHDLDLSQRWIVHDYGLYVLEQPLPPNSTIIGLQGETTLLRYFQQTAGLRPDISLMAADQEAARRQAVSAALSGGGSAYITRPLPGITADYSLGSVTGLIDVVGELETLLHVGTPASDLPTVPHPVDQELAPGLHLRGYDLHEHHAHWQGWLRLKIWWQAPDGIQSPFKVSARLLDAGGHTVAATDAAPVAGAYPGPEWRPGEVVVDAYEIALPAGLPPGTYTPLVIVYDPDTGAELGRAELAALDIDGSPARPPRQALAESLTETTCALWGELRLLGFAAADSETAYQPGDLLPLTLLWQARAQPQGDLRLVVSIEGYDDEPLAEAPVGGAFPASRWSPDQVVRQWLQPRIPDEIPPGSYRLWMRVTRDGRPLPWGCWILPGGSNLDLGTLQIQ